MAMATIPLMNLTAQNNQPLPAKLRKKGKSWLPGITKNQKLY